MKDNELKIKRKPVKGLLLLYYRALYSANQLKSAKLFNFPLGYIEILRLLITVNIMVIILPIIILLDPLFGMLISKWDNWNLDLSVYILIILPLIFSHILTKYIIASDTLIEKISQYDEVVVTDYYEKKKYFVNAGWIGFGMFIIFAILSSVVFLFVTLLTEGLL